MKKKTLKLHTVMRLVIQAVFFILMPSAFTTAFSGIKYIFTHMGAREYLEFTSFLSVLTVLCLYTVIFGRFFCGFACAFGSFGDWIHGLYIVICKKIKKKPVQIDVKWKKRLSWIKYIVLSVIIVLCFEQIYGKMSGWNPWVVFSMIRSGNTNFDSYILGVVILIIIIIGMAVCERFFCLFLCPMGAVFSILPVLPVFALHRKRNECINGCNACGNKCPSGIGLPDADGTLSEDVYTGDCFMCQKCMDICPKENIKKGKGFLWKGNEIWFILFRAVLLAVLLIYAGI
ncbi:MAG: 4Fe-4S binding protein [Lachnospiraceae bacterium]|nr:4Fe-4S binding protein [Lachnospiraceae bacterium]